MFNAGSDSSLFEAVTPERVKKDRTKKSQESVDIATRQWGAYTRARDAGHADWVDEALKCEDYFLGNQWKPTDKTQLEKEGRPCLTINMILSTVNIVAGEQMGRRLDIRYKPRKNADKDMAKAMTLTAMKVTDDNQFPWVESEVFQDGLIMGRGYFDLRMNFEKDRFGDITIDSASPTQVIPDPDATSYDPAEWKEVFTTRRVSLDDIEMTYGKEQMEEVKALANRNTTFGKDSIDIVRGFGQREHNDWGAPVPHDEDEEVIIRSALLVERQYYRNHQVFVVADPRTGQERELPEKFKKSEAKRFAKENGMALFPKTKRRVRWTVTCDRVVLHDEWSPYRSFTVVPYFPYFRRGRTLGIVAPIMSPQEQLNKISSKELEIVNQTANSGWMVERGSLANMNIDEFRGRGSESGLVVEYNPGRTPPEKIKSNTIPTGIDRMSLKAQINIKEISGVSDALRGEESAEVSGIALDSKEHRGQVQIQPVLDNLERSQFLVAVKIKELVQDFYTNERTFSYVDEEAVGQPEQQLNLNQPQQDGSVKNDLSKGEYDCVITTMPIRDSFDDIQLAEALNLRRAGVNIPDHHVVMHSHLNKKEEIAQEVKQMAGLNPPSEVEQQQQLLEQQLAVDHLRAEIRELQAKAASLEAKAGLDEAKAADLQDNDIELAKVRTSMDEKQEELRLRERLARISADSKVDVANIGLMGRQQDQSNKTKGE